MFYCNDCAKENDYPETITKSQGPCELCGKVAICNDMPSSKLPKRKFYCDTETSGLNPITMSYPVGIGKVYDDGKPVVMKGYPVIKIPANGKPDWYEGARTWCFVYSRDNGNFILEGFRGEVEAYLKKTYTHYFCYISMWNHGESRGHWDFWKDYVGIFAPDKHRKDWKYTIRPYSNAYGHVTPKEEIEEKTLRFKRMPKHWIQEFNKL